MRAILRNFIPLLSAAIGILALVLFFRSFSHRDTWEFSTLRAHYTVYSKGGFVVVMGPPPMASGLVEAQAWRSLKRLQNDQFIFQVIQGRYSEPVVEIKPVPGSAAEELGALPDGLSTAALLRGLDGPRKFAAADLLLAFPHGMKGIRGTALLTEKNGTQRFQIGAYSLLLPPPPRQPQAGPADRAPPVEQTTVFNFRGPNIPSVDLSLRKQTSRRRHQLMDIPVARFHFAWIIGSALLLPALQLPRLWKHGLQRRRKCCA